jgi:hypothetical protein
MKHNAHLDALTLVLESENAEHRIIEGAARLNHVIVHGVDRAVERDPSRKAVGAPRRPGCGYLLGRERRPAVRQYVNGSLRQLAADYRKQRYKAPPPQQRLAADKADRFGRRVKQIDAGCNLVDYL